MGNSLALSLVLIPFRKASQGMPGRIQKVDPPQGSVIYTIGVLEFRTGGSLTKSVILYHTMLCHTRVQSWGSGNSGADHDPRTDSKRKRSCMPRPPNRPLLRALWYLLDGICGVLKASWGVLVLSTVGGVLMRGTQSLGA